MSIAIGTKAPAFSLNDTEKKKVTLEDFKGQNLVILFFPLAFTSVCTAELCSVRDSLATYNGLNTAVVGISVDSPFTLGKFKAEQNLNFPLLSDFNKEASQAYGAYYDNFVLDLKGVSKRAAFVVDKEGTVKYAQVLESAGDLPDFEAIKKTLADLQ
ncbi:redoxin domain-containing protein [Chitinophaga silvisoli]|uniref:Peroxiredoxin n=1 Tax=Chitinophaga silvisoli TaxID=2291814 RepID=A0A3E1P216_9BACT|nr:redoxin domain-containing protein [Chitinophaga silvisoli]RFM34219.1 peroxiredoxin [Chitinophaga silvisoli]